MQEPMVSGCSCSLPAPWPVHCGVVQPAQRRWVREPGGKARNPAHQMQQARPWCIWRAGLPDLYLRLLLVPPL